MEAEASRERELRPPDWGGSADLDTLPPEGFSADCVADLVLPPLFAGVLARVSRWSRARFSRRPSSLADSGGLSLLSSVPTPGGGGT